jgi:hypothetical protein
MALVTRPTSCSHILGSGLVRRSWSGAFILLLATACIGRTLPIEFDLDQPRSRDGLYRLKTIGIGAVWAKPGSKLGGYHAVAIDPITLTYRRQPRPGQLFNRSGSNYSLDKSAQKRLEQTLEREIRHEINASDSFDVRAERSPGVLRISLHVVDFVWEVPPMWGNDREWVMRTGVMTLVANLSDHETGEIYARIVDRREIRPAGSGSRSSYENNGVNNWTGVKDVSKTWGVIIRRVLDALHAVPQVPFPPSASSPFEDPGSTSALQRTARGQGSESSNERAD